MNKLYSLIAIIFILSGCCNEVPLELPEFTLPVSEKRVLVEELTGVQCINCPDGATTIKNIQTLYPGKVISIAIHAGSLSEPMDENKYDLRCEDGINIEGSWAYLGKPAAAIDRVAYEEPEIPVSGYTSWQTYIEQELLKENVINIEVISDFDVDSRAGTVKVSALPLKNIEGNFKIFVALIENKIVDSQKLKNGSIDEEYEFENVLRDMITPYNGTEIANQLKKNTLVTKSFNFSLPASDGTWIPENMKIVAFVTGNYEYNYETVMNVTEIDLVK